MWMQTLEPRCGLSVQLWPLIYININARERNSLWYPHAYSHIYDFVAVEENKSSSGSSGLALVAHTPRPVPILMSISVAAEVLYCDLVKKQVFSLKLVCNQNKKC